MSHFDRLRIITVAIWAALVCLTALTMYVTYGSGVFVKLPWIRFSVAISLLTCLWAYLFWFYLLGDDKENTRKNRNLTFNSAGFAIVVIPLDVVLVHPSLSARGLAGEGDYFVLLLMLVLIHGIGFYFMQTEIQESLEK
jgi:hypothetical protein